MLKSESEAEMLDRAARSLETEWDSWADAGIGIIRGGKSNYIAEFELRRGWPDGAFRLEPPLTLGLYRDVLGVYEIVDVDSMVSYGKCSGAAGVKGALLRAVEEVALSERGGVVKARLGKPRPVAEELAVVPRAARGFLLSE